MSELDNLRRWNDADRGVYEVWYLTWNHAPTETGYWLRYVTEAPLPGHGEPRAELWFARFDARRPDRTFGFHRRFAAAQLRADEHPFRLTLADAELRHDGARGSVSGDGHEVSWDLRWPPSAATHRHLPAVMYRNGGLGETTVQTPNPRVVASGSVTVDGERLELSNVALGQTHLWGKKHAHSWAWGRVAEWDDGREAVLETLSVRLVRRGLRLPRMSLSTLILGREVISSVGFVRGLRNHAEWSPGRYHFTAEAAGGIRLEAEMSAAPDRLITAPYVDPDGDRVFCANTEIGDAVIQVWRKEGRTYEKAERLVATRTAHFESGGRDADPRIVRRHVTVE